MEDKVTPLVLLVDADPAVHDSVAAALGVDWGFLGTRTGELALKVAAKRTISVALVDSELAGGSPELVFTRLRELQPHLRAVFLGVAPDPATAARLAALGAVLPKPIGREALRDALRAATHLQVMSKGVEQLRLQTTRRRVPKPHEG